MRKRFFGFAVILGIAAISYQAGMSFAKQKDDLYKELEIFSESLAVVEEKYVEDKKAQDLIYGAMEGLMASLDSYSQFLTPEDYANLLVETEGKFGGLGIEITMRDGLLTVVSPIEDTPAWKAGVKAGDIIVKIEGELTRGITLNEAVKKMRGKPGTDVTITVLREKPRKIEDIKITRGIIKIEDIKRAVILKDDIAYLRISEFRETTAKDLSKALTRLNKAGMKALIVDVRNNPGGLLSSAVDVSSIFLPSGKVIVSTKSRSEDEKIYSADSKNNKHTQIPIVVLINKGSASGSEILAAALRENDRAILLGEKTFGKGSVQTIIPLSDGSALRVTTSKYYTPAGKSIHEKGIDPDIEVTKEVSDEEKEDVFKELEAKKEEFDYKKDYQIVRALDLIKGIQVLKAAK
ncbi:MAG: S41 family peptidase [Candidatus Omnitrophica bacterium]|nr:S41 family peptidase [Candidatus Omnitrophota bacterium]MDD5430302.1 S41 family peptidase [Candidatus Omnitrophota bacterium]